MDAFENNIYAIERYLTGKMDSDENAAFEKRLQSDQQLNDDLSFFKNTEEIWKQSREYDEVNKEIGKVIALHRKARRTRKIRLIAAIVSIPILITVFFIVFQRNNGPDEFVQDFDEITLDNPEIIYSPYKAHIDSFNIDANHIVSEKMPISNIASLDKRKNYISRGFVKIQWDPDRVDLTTDFLYLKNKQGVDIFLVEVNISENHYMLNSIDLESGRYMCGLKNSGLKSILILRNH
ncbi:MAG: hypothetical protein EOL95_10035 [Bacteroidia bacterium]|nr:hypothetical protein [Bacteroidia bacterium]